MEAVTCLTKCASHFSSLTRRCFFSKVSSHASSREDPKNNHVQWSSLVVQASTKASTLRDVKKARTRG
ncbi:tuberin [Sesbania bispinosa]|nr:tuberin [Sesbania bispinosa]